VVVPRGTGDISTPYDDRTETELVSIIVPSAGLPITPRTGDTVSIPNRPGRFSVTDCKPIKPDGSDILFTVHAERGAWVEEMLPPIDQIVYDGGSPDMVASENILDGGAP
jgi:hypothetical protein